MDKDGIYIEFSQEEIREMLDYQQELGTDTVQSAIMNAIRIAMDDLTYKGGDVEC